MKENHKKIYVGLFVPVCGKVSADGSFDVLHTEFLRVLSTTVYWKDLWGQRIIILPVIREICVDGSINILHTELLRVLRGTIYGKNLRGKRGIINYCLRQHALENLWWCKQHISSAARGDRLRNLRPISKNILYLKSLFFLEVFLDILI